MTPLARYFYETALDEIDRARFLDAMQLDGVEEEAAVIRVRILRALEEHPDDIKLLDAGVRLLLQTLLTQRRIRPEQHDDLVGHAAATLGGLLESIGLIPAEGAGRE